MLRVRALQAAYGASQVLFDVSLDVGAGEVVTLLGRNGMGKTTTIRAIMGLMPPPCRRACAFDGARSRSRGRTSSRGGASGLCRKGGRCFRR